MNFFLIKCIKFFGILMIISCCLYGCLDYLNSKKLNDYISSIDKKSMFIGDSHIQNGINDELITDGINFSQNGESYYFSYQKLKKHFQANLALLHHEIQRGDLYASNRLFQVAPKL